MKRFLFLGCCLLGLLPMALFAQPSLNMHEAGGANVQYSLANIKSLTFSNSNNTMQVNTISSGSATYAFSSLAFLNFTSSLTGLLSPYANPSDLNLYPNPVTANQFTLNYKLTTAGLVQIEVLNIPGASVLQTTVQANAGTNKTVIDIDGLQTGTYFCKVVSSNGAEVKKLIKY